MTKILRKLNGPIDVARESIAFLAGMIILFLVLFMLFGCGAGHIPGTGGDHFTQRCDTLIDRGRLDCLEND